jgi:osmotically-inducible protein OsmY
MDDKQLRDDAIEELDWESSIDSADIGVAAENGVVTLSGHVPTFAQKVKAEEAVKRVRGVRAIAQEIEVRPPQTASRADDEIAKRALNMLNWDVTIPRDAIQLKIQDGWMTLSGEVAWEYQRRAAEDDIRKLSGVLGVTNLIKIRRRLLAMDVKKRVEDALKRNAQFEADGIRVSVQDGTVKLQGKVHTWHDRDLLEAAVWGAPGVKMVEDNVSIG